MSYITELINYTYNLMLDYTTLIWMHLRRLGFNEHKELCKKQKLMLQEAYFATRKNQIKECAFLQRHLIKKLCQMSPQNF